MWDATAGCNAGHNPASLKSRRGRCGDLLDKDWGGVVRISHRRCRQDVLIRSILDLIRRQKCVSTAPAASPRQSSRSPQAVRGGVHKLNLPVVETELLRHPLPLPTSVQKRVVIACVFSTPSQQAATSIEQTFSPGLGGDPRETLPRPSLC
jgi:hypothetical protein